MAVWGFARSGDRISVTAAKPQRDLGRLDVWGAVGAAPTLRGLAARRHRGDGGTRDVQVLALTGCGVSPPRVNSDQDNTRAAHEGGQRGRAIGEGAKSAPDAAHTWVGRCLRRL